MVWTVAIILVSGFALVVGGRPERLVAVANLVAWVATLGLGRGQDWLQAQWGVLAVDVGFFLFLTYLAVTSGMNWLLFAAAFQLLGTATHFAMVVGEGFQSRTYVWALIIWSYLVLMSLAVGAFTAWRVRRQRPAPP